jgi:hypothetical protein
MSVGYAQVPIVGAFSVLLGTSAIEEAIGYKSHLYFIEHERLGFHATNTGAHRQ